MSGVQLFFYVLFLGFGWNSPQLKQTKAECLDCHKQLVAEKVIHPVAEGCDNCHVANGKEHPQPKIIGFSLADTVPNLCFTCHDELKTTIQSSAVTHGAVRSKKSCTSCHSPHSSPNDKMLLADGKDLCLSCHNKIITTDSIQIPNMKSLLDNSKVIHGAIDAGGCIACHNPHASNHQFLLKENFPQGIYAEGKTENYTLCFTCHDSQLLTEATTTSATQFRNADKNLHFVHLQGKKGRACTVCHNVHGSANMHLLNDATTFGNWQMPIRYKPVEGGGSCYPGCHGERAYKN